MFLTFSIKVSREAFCASDGPFLANVDGLVLLVHSLSSPMINSLYFFPSFFVFV